jgi:hypothetical protein
MKRFVQTSISLLVIWLPGTLDAQLGALVGTALDSIVTLTIQLRLENTGNMVSYTDSLAVQNPNFGDPGLLYKGKSAVFAQGVWMGAYDASSQLHVTAQTYRQDAVLHSPGPIGSTGVGSPCWDSTAALGLDTIFRVSRLQVEQFQQAWQNGTVQPGQFPQVEGWPGNFPNANGCNGTTLAPFVDVNGDGFYNPILHGDYPVMLGDEMRYWVMNDLMLGGNSNWPAASGAFPLGVEIHCFAYAYTCANPVLGNTIFFRQYIRNKSGINYPDFRMALWNDDDIGFFADDRAAIDTNRSVVITINGDAIDGSSMYGWYVQQPPIVSTILLQSPLAPANNGINDDHDAQTDEVGERMGFRRYLSYQNNFTITGNPSESSDYWSYMNGQWKDSSFVVDDRALNPNGYLDSGEVAPPTLMMTPDITPDGIWCSNQYNGAATNKWSDVNPPFDRRTVATIGPLPFANGQELMLEYAIHINHDTLPTNGLPVPLRPLCSLLNAADSLQAWYKAGSTPCGQVLSAAVETVAPAALGVQVLPNPGSTAFEVRSSQPLISVRVFDAAGRLMHQLPVTYETQLRINVQEWPIGLYYVTATGANGAAASTRFVKQ